MYNKLLELLNLEVGDVFKVKSERDAMVGAYEVRRNSIRGYNTALEIEPHVIGKIVLGRYKIEKKESYFYITDNKQIRQILSADPAILKALKADNNLFTSRLVAEEFLKTY